MKAAFEYLLWVLACILVSIIAALEDAWAPRS